jgi:hypothetical protein
MGSPKEVVSPFLQGVDDSEQFMVIDVIVSFHGTQHFRQIGARTQVPVGVLLH